MAKKNIAGAAQHSISVLDTIAAGNAQGVQDVQHVQDVQKEKPKPAKKNENKGRPLKYESEGVRLNLRIPKDLRDYLQEAAYYASTPKKTVSLTEYLCDLIREDKAKNGR